MTLTNKQKINGDDNYNSTTGKEWIDEKHGNSAPDKTDERDNNGDFKGGAVT